MKDMHQTTPDVAQYIVSSLADAGVRSIYAITGDSLNAITDAVARDGRIRFIHMRHEESGAFAASAEAQITGQMAVCAGSSGPGHIHLINGLYDAQRSFAPVLAIASTCPSSVFGTGYFQETDPTLLFSDCSIYNHIAANTSQVAPMLGQAMQQAVSRRGVAVVGIPADLTTEKMPEATPEVAPLLTSRLPEPTDVDIDRAAHILNKASKVTIFAGSGAAGAGDLLRKVAEQLNAPLVTTFKSQLELTAGAKNYVGHVGYLGMWSAENALADADAVLTIGTNFPFPGFFPDKAQIIQVDVRAENIGKRMRVDLPVRADSRLFLEALLPLLTATKSRAHLDSALADYADIQKELLLPVSHPGSKGAIRPEYVFHTLNRLADQNAIFTVDTGMNCVWASHYLQPAAGRTMIGSFTHGSMANAMPQAIGAAVCAPERQVIALSGDGGFTMLLGDLLTIAQYKLPVKILVADNRSLAYVKWEMELAGYTPSEVNLTNPDFGAMARSMGIAAQTVDDPANLEAAMTRWLATPGPALLSVVTDADAASFTFSKAMMDHSSPTLPTSNFLPLGSL